jgi:hypothetical protein
VHRYARGADPSEGLGNHGPACSERGMRSCQWEPDHWLRSPRPSWIFPVWLLFYLNNAARIKRGRKVKRETRGSPSVLSFALSSSISAYLPSTHVFTSPIALFAYVVIRRGSRLAPNNSFNNFTPLFCRQLIFILFKGTCRAIRNIGLFTRPCYPFD